MTAGKCAAIIRTVSWRIALGLSTKLTIEVSDAVDPLQFHRAGAPNLLRAPCRPASPHESQAARPLVERKEPRRGQRLLRNIPPAALLRLTEAHAMRITTVASVRSSAGMSHGSRQPSVDGLPS